MDALGDLSVCVALADQSKNLRLVVVQGRTRLGWRRVVPLHALQEPSGDRRRYHSFTPVHGPDALAEGELLNVFHHIAARAGVDAIIDQLIISERRDDEDSDLGMGGAEEPARFGSTDAR